MRIIKPFTFWDMRTLDLRNVCLQTYRDNWIRQKVAYFLRKMQSLGVNNSRILRIQNEKFSGYHFYMNTTKYRDFQICISVPLIFFMDDKQLLVNLDCYLMLCFVYIKHLYNCFLILLHLFHMDMFLPNRLIVFFSHR